MPAKKKKKKSKRSPKRHEQIGAYQTQKGGPILNDRNTFMGSSWLADPFSKTADKVMSVIKKRKTPEKKGKR